MPRPCARRLAGRAASSPPRRSRRRSPGPSGRCPAGGRVHERRLARAASEVGMSGRAEPAHEGVDARRVAERRAEDVEPLLRAGLGPDPDRGLERRRGDPAAVLDLVDVVKQERDVARPVVGAAVEPAAVPRVVVAEEPDAEMGVMRLEPRLRPRCRRLLAVGHLPTDRAALCARLHGVPSEQPVEEGFRFGRGLGLRSKNVHDFVPSRLLIVAINFYPRAGPFVAGRRFPFLQCNGFRHVQRFIAGSKSVFRL